MKRSLMACAALALALSGCGPAPGNDPIYQALKANPPTEIPARHLPKLRTGVPSCDVFNRGKADQYMTCWWPFGHAQFASLSYYGAGSFPPPDPSRLRNPGGQPITRVNIPN